MALALEWQTRLDPSGAFAEQLVAIHELPVSMGTGAPDEHRSGGCVNLGVCRQKQSNMTKWAPGVHQLMVFVGTSRTGKAASARKMHKHREKKKETKR